MSRRIPLGRRLCSFSIGLKCVEKKKIRVLSPYSDTRCMALAKVL